MKYFVIFDKNVATIFLLHWNIENIPDIFLQYSVLCGRNWNSETTEHSGFAVMRGEN